MRLSLRAILVLFLAGLQLAALAATLIPSYLNSERTLMRHAGGLMRDVAFATIEHSKQFLAPAEIAAELSKRLAENQIVASDDPVELEKLLFEQLQLNPQFSGVYYGDATGNFVFVMRSPDGSPGPFRSKQVSRVGGSTDTLLKWRDQEYELLATRFDPKDSYDPRQRPWYRDAERAAATIWTEPYIFYTSKNPGVTVASPIVGSNGSVTGVIGVDIEIGAISDFLSNLEIGENGRALILNHNGDVIAHPDQDLIKTEGGDALASLRFVGIDEIADPVARAAFAPLLTDGRLSLPDATPGEPGSHVSTSFEHAGAEYVATITPMQSHNHHWTIGVYAPKNDFVGDLNAGRDRGIAIALFVAVATAALGAFLASRIHAPVRELADRANQIAEGKVAPPAPFPNSFLEISKAGNAFNRMSTWLQGYKEENAALARDLKSASQALEERVEDRTSDLAHLNEQLAAEVETRADAETTLKQEIQQHAETAARLRVAIAAAENANDAKTRFLSSMSHELRSPLNAIIGFADLLAEGTPATPDQKRIEYLEHIRNSGGHLLALVNDMLDLESIETGQLSLHVAPIDLDAALGPAKLEQAMPARVGGGRIDDQTSAQATPQVQGDVNRLRQVFVNLLSNAIKYGPADGTVTITAEPLTTHLRVAIQDEGAGIAPELQSRLFRPFDRLGAEASGVEGTGVGLALAKQLIESMGGRIGVDSAPGEGSRFWVDVPLAKAETGDQAVDAFEPAERLAPTCAKRILYVDDNDINLKLIEDYLSAREGLHVIAARSGTEGLQLAREAPFDIYLIDINLPDMDGFDLLREIRELRDDAIVIAVSADAMPTHVERGLKAGFNGYVTKPVRLRALAEDIENRISG